MKSNAITARRRLELIAWLGALLPLVVLGGNITGASWPAHLALMVFAGIAALLVFSNVVDSIREPRFSIQTALDWGWLALVGVTLVSALFGDVRRDIEAWVFPLALQVAYFYGIVALRRRGWAAENWLRALLIVTTALGVWAVWLTISASRQNAGLQPPSAFAVTSSFRLYAILDNPNVFGAFLAMAIPAALGYAAWTPSLAGRAIVIPWLILVGAVLILTGSRGGQVATLVGSVGAIVLIVTPQRIFSWARQKRSRQVIISAAVGLVVIGLVGLLILESGATRGVTSGVRRLALWQTALTSARSKPIFGIGMGEFPAAQQTQQSVPPIGIEHHAHNLYLNMLAESGIVGLTALALLIGLLCRAVWQQWRVADRSQRALIGGLAGALIAFGVVGLVDDPMAQAAPLTLVVMMMALLTAGDNSRRLTYQPPEGGLENNAKKPLLQLRDWALLAASVAICAGAAFLVIRYSALWTGGQIGANTVDGWRSAAQALDQAAINDPSDPLVQAQAAVAWARVGTFSSSNDEVNNALERAIAYYRVVVRLDPAASIQHLNLGALLAHQGQLAEALPELAKAASEAPDSAIAHLNYGVGLEAAGQTDQAMGEYRQALEIDPRWHEALFWQATPMRQMVWQSIPESGTFWAMLQNGEMALQNGNREAATAAYTQAFGIAPDDTARAVAGGMVAYSKGDMVGARYDLESAIAFGGEDMVRAHLYLGDLDASQNDLNGMLAEYAQAFQAIDRYGEGGPGSAADITYAVNAFGRYAYIADYLPEVTLLDLTPDMARRFITLAQSRVTAGDKPSAAYIYRRILEANLGYAPAENGLAALGPE